MLLAEPSGHVKDAAFAEELEAAAAAGFQVIERPAMRRLQTAVLRKTADDGNFFAGKGTITGDVVSPALSSEEWGNRK